MKTQQLRRRLAELYRALFASPPGGRPCEGMDCAAAAASDDVYCRSCREQIAW